MTHGKAMIELETPKLIQRTSLFAFNCKTIDQQNNKKKIKENKSNIKYRNKCKIKKMQNDNKKKERKEIPRQSPLHVTCKLAWRRKFVECGTGGSEGGRGNKECWFGCCRPRLILWGLQSLCACHFVFDERDGRKQKLMG